MPITLHTHFQITPAQHAEVNALRTRLTAAITGTEAWKAARAVRLLNKLNASVGENSKVGLSLFLGDWREGIEAECCVLERANLKMARAA